MEIKEVHVKTILVSCRIPGIDFTINPYIGCQFACKYCYASFMGRFVSKKVSDWGNYVYVKINAPELLAKELPKKLARKGIGREIFISSVTDPYQGLEVKYKLTRRILDILADFGFAGNLSILTKSDLVLRDIDILKKLKRVAVGLTVTSTEDSIARYFEKHAPPISRRLAALKILNQQKIPTYAFIGPLLPHFVTKKDRLEELFQKLVESGTKDIFIEHLNLSPYIRGRLMKEMRGTEREILKKFYLSQTKSYRQEIEKIIADLVAKYKMNLMLDMVIFHHEFHDRRSPWH